MNKKRRNRKKKRKNRRKTNKEKGKITKKIRWEGKKRWKIRRKKEKMLRE